MHIPYSLSCLYLLHILFSYDQIILQTGQRFLSTQHIDMT